MCGYAAALEGKKEERARPAGRSRRRGLTGSLEVKLWSIVRLRSAEW